MIEQLPRYTWSGGAGMAHIYRRSGIYGQEHVLTVSIPSLRLGGPGLNDLLHVSANALCEYLSEREEDRPAAPDSGGTTQEDRR